MTKEERRRSLLSVVWRALNAIAVVLGILAAIVAILAYLEARGARRDVKAFIKDGKEWELSLSLTEPVDRTEISGYVVRIAGSVEFRTTAAEMRARPKANLALEEKSVELVPFMRPLSEAKWWWAQARPLIRQDGSFEGSVFVGEKTGAGVGVEFQLAVLAVPKGSVLEGDRVVNLPFFFAASNTVTIRRVR